MKSEAEIQDRIRFLLSRELDRRVEEATQRLPVRCKYNHRQPLDTRKHIQGEPNPDFNRITRAVHLPVYQTIGLCMYGCEDPAEWDAKICEDPIDAKRCEVFDPHTDKEAVLERFQAEVRDMVWVELNLPEVYGLLWALGTERSPKLPWWKLLWFRFLKIRPEPLLPYSQAADTEPWEPK